MNGWKLVTVNEPTSVMSRAISDRAIRLLASHEEQSDHAQQNVIDLTTPDVSALPAHIVSGAKEALDRGETHYTSRPGVPELRAAIAAVVRAEGIPASADTVVITNGGAEATYIALQAVLKSGDRVAVVEPVAPNVIDMIQFVGADLVKVQPPAENRFKPIAMDLPTSGVQALLLTTPSSITGVAMRPTEIQTLLSAAVERGMVPILDRSLALCQYEPRDDVFDNQDLMSQVITIGSFSTAYGLGGWRIGYFSAPDERATDLAKLKQAMSICTTAVSQFAALSALRGPTEWTEERRRRFADRKARAIEVLTVAGISVIDPDAYPSLMIRAPSEGDDVSLSKRLRDEAGVIVEAGSSFGESTRGFIRVDLGVDDETRIPGIERIAACARNGSSNGSR